MIRQLLIKNIERHASKWMILAIDLLIVAFSFLVSYFMRFSIAYNFTDSNFLVQLAFVVSLSGFVFLITGSYKGIIRQTGLKDAYKLVNAMAMLWIICYCFVKIIRMFFNLEILNMPISVVNLFCIWSLGMLIISRVLFKYLYNYTKQVLGHSSKVESIQVLIYGGGEAGMRTLNTLVNNSEKLITVTGFITNNKQEIGRTINGIPFYDSVEVTKSFINKMSIKEVIISDSNIETVQLNQVYNKYISLGLQVKLVPHFKDWTEGKLKVSQIKQIEIEDLLDRAPIAIENKNVIKEFENKTVLVTGAAGSIGKELVIQLLKLDIKKLILLDQAESALYDLQQNLIQDKASNFEIIVTDIRNRKSIENIFEHHKPNIVFHAAAYKHVPLMEEFPAESVKTNILGTCILADNSVKYNVEKFIFISTDKAVNPTNVMGATKRVAEIYLQSLDVESTTKFVTTRFGNVLGSNGSVIPLFKKQIDKGGPITVTDKEITRYFMTIPEASQLVIEAATMGNGGEIFLFDMGQPVKIFDLAKRMISLSGLNYPKDIDIEIVGLRPGEKLYEELLTTSENSLPTYHKKIKINKSSPQKLYLDNQLIIKNFLNSQFENSNEYILRTLKEIVPEYTPKNPIYKLTKPLNTNNELNFNSPLYKVANS